MPTEFTYMAYHPLQRTQIASLTLRDPVWTESVNAGSVLTAKVTVPDNPFQIARIKEATQPDQSALYVYSGLGRIPWGGVVKKREWNEESNSYTITVLEWRSWLFTQVVGPYADLSGSPSYVWTQVDQLQIARNIISIVVTGGVAAGVPPIYVDIQESGVLRDLTVLGTSMRTAGSYLDEIANREGGFEWDLEPFIDEDGAPALRFSTHFPERGGVQPQLLFSQSSNILSVSDIAESTESRATRIWAVGEGPNAESLPYSVDDDPDLATGYVLRSDKVTTYQTVTNRTTLASYARAERRFLNSPINLVEFNVQLDSPEYNSYAKGDRCRVVIQDRVTQIDQTGVRILEREVHPDEGYVKLTVNLNDQDALEVDEDGAV